ncbi:PGF-pre-PGF domain-containing protein [Methanolobus vulcani]|uniref:PGF-pre-PGF domain-containing protein n=1 Tax=Methanolobus vulcani TaxID=38026 RepID=A0A7Z8KN27_9EURY|nr:PGF-pre-PGF domain-containing protein [Methanolobus vulcani]TQD25168.1 PGF-pre-PGF domain-containing protein [Methanolobus vulcani]
MDSNLKIERSFLRFLLILILLISLQSTSVAAVTDTPVLDVIGDHSVNENSLLTFTLSADDPENDTLEFSCPNIDSIAGATLDSSSGLFEWTPTYEQAGEYLVQFVVSDGSHIDSEYITVTVKNTNRAPVFSAIADSSTNEDEEIQLILEATDEDSDILAFSKDVSFGTLEGNIFTWTPDYDDQGEHEIVFSVTDGSSSVSQTALITVSNVNREPVLFSISDVSVPQNTPVTIQLEAFDADGDELTYTMVSNLPTGASFDSETGLFQWPTPSVSIKVFTFSVTDGIGSDSSTAIVVIGDSKTPPTMSTIGPQSVDENSELSFMISAEFYTKKPSFSFPDGFPSNPTITMPDSSSIQVTWTPSYEESGSYKVEFQISDGTSYSTYQVVDITVNDVNRAPVIDAVDDYTVSENGILYVNLSATDPDGDTLTYSTDSSLGIVRGNTFICTPDYADAGVYDVQYTVSDGNLKNSTTATITVTDSNMPPKINSISPMEVVVNNTLDFSLSVSDDDEGESFSYKALDMPSTASFDESEGIFEWTPSSEDVGDYSVSFYVSDSSQEDYETVSITVTETSSSSSSSTTSSSSSSGGGGAPLTSGEEFDNIDFKDYSLESVVRDVETTFSFYKENNSIVSLSFTSELNGGQVKAVIEVLKDTSSQVKSVAPGDVYKNMNIDLDSNLGDDVIGDRVINFKVEKVWVEENNINVSFITLCRYNSGGWDMLSTEAMEEDDGYYYFTSTTPGFSPFAISSVDPSTLTTEASAEKIEATSVDIEQLQSTEDDESPLDSGAALPQKESSSYSYLVIIGLIGVVAIGVVGYRNRENYEKVKLQLGNPDGKRYRRIKK